MTTLELRRTHRTVVERIRRPSEREFTLEAALEPAVAVEPRTTDERIDISIEYSAGTLAERMLPNGVQRLHRIAQDAPACDILHLVSQFPPGVSMNSFGMVAAVGVCLGGAAAYALLRRRSSPDELERQRRDLLVQQGRIIDATVIDISDLTAEESGRPNGMQLILYKYEAAGVVYECSQDVTMLRHLVNIYDCRLGFPASVRYDPHNPGNSLIVAESWSGLRDTANSVPLHGRSSAPAPSLR
jgi:hypothetical protein